MTSTTSDSVTVKKRPTRAAHVWAGLASLGVPILLMLLARVLLDRESGIRAVGLMCCCWLFYAFREHIYQLGDLLEKKLLRSVPEHSRESVPAALPAGDDWYRMSVNGSVFLAVGVIVVMASKGLETYSNKERIAQFTHDRLVRMGQSTSGYWQSTVANLHTVRFETPSGLEPAEKYYDRMFQELRLQTDAAKSASTVDVDPELFQLVTGHLRVDNQVLQWRQKLNEFMQQNQIPAPTDTVDQRMAMTQLLLGMLQLNSEALKKMPAGPERDLIEKGLELEQLQQEQFREIEIMQAVLRERYKGVAFPLPAINR